MPGARELHMLRSPRNRTYDIVRILCESTGRGVAWRKDIMHALTHTRFHGGVMVCAEAQRTADSPAARSFLRFILRVLSKLERNGPEKLSVRGKNAWWGKQHTLRVNREGQELSEAELDMLMVDKEVHAEANGLPPPKRWRVKRVYVPKCNAQGRHQQMGLARDIDKCTRTVGRYAAAAKVNGLFKSWLPRAGSEDAIMPRVGTWAYPEFTLLREPPEGLLARLRKWWGERVKSPAQAPRARVAGEPSRMFDSDATAPRGPPQARLTAAQPSEDHARAASLGLSLSDLDAIEQLCGQL